jgi:hypothetical protein
MSQISRRCQLPTTNAALKKAAVMKRIQRAIEITGMGQVPPNELEAQGPFFQLQTGQTS